MLEEGQTERTQLHNGENESSFDSSVAAVLVLYICQLPQEVQSPAEDEELAAVRGSNRLTIKLLLFCIADTANQHTVLCVDVEAMRRQIHAQDARLILYHV